MSSQNKAYDKPLMVEGPAKPANEAYKLDELLPVLSRAFGVRVSHTAPLSIDGNEGSDVHELRVGRNRAVIKMISESFDSSKHSSDFEGELSREWEKHDTTDTSGLSPKVLAVVAHSNEQIAALVLDFLEGPTLRDLIKDGQIPREELKAKLTTAISLARDKGLWLVDPNPENFVLTEDGTFKVYEMGMFVDSVEEWRDITMVQEDFPESYNPVQIAEAVLRTAEDSPGSA